MELNFNAGDQDLERLGYTVIQQRWLKDLRSHLGLSRNALADLLKVTVITLKRWEDDEVRIWARSAIQVGTFYVEALKGLQALAESGYANVDLVLLDRVPGMLGVAQVPYVASLTTIDLGVLGKYTPKSEVDSLRREMKKNV